jgi:meso-butanediol dehydrogenase/(S,S)-butanediol dehydrogenase/diacetyl reductase
MEFAGKAAIVTGAASGIGAETARLLVEAGAQVLAVDVDQAKLQAVAAKLGDGCIPHVADMAERSQVEGMVEAAVDRFRGLDVLVNNAGIGSLGRTADLDPDDWRRVMAIDLDAVYWASRRALPHLVASKGSIVSTASISGMAADYAFTAYNVAKAGVIAFTRCMAIDYAAQGVRVNCVSPGFVATPLTGVSPQATQAEFIRRVPMQRAARPEELAQAIVFLASPRASYVTGHNFVVDGGVMAHTGQPDVLAIRAQLAAGQ